MRYLQALLVAAPLLATLVATGGAAFRAPVHDIAEEPADVTIIGAGPNDHLGGSVAAGDFNGDGIADLLVGARGGANARGLAGVAYVILGSSDLAGTIDLRSTAPDFTVVGANWRDSIGEATAGDFNGDGIDDILVSAPEADGPGTVPCVIDEETGDEVGDRCGAGMVYVLFGSRELAGTLDLASEQPDFTVIGAHPSNFLGSNAIGGDFNGDTIDDLLMMGQRPEETGAALYVVFGSPGLGGTLDLASNPPDITFVGGRLTGGLAAADINGDGVDDLLFGDPAARVDTKDDVGALHVVFGSDTLSDTIDLEVNPPDITVVGQDPQDFFASSITIGDFNGDGTGDVMAAAPGAEGPAGEWVADDAVHERVGGGQAYVIFGSHSLSGTWDLAHDPADLTVLGPWPRSELGLSAMASGDINADGTDELVMNARGLIPYDEHGQSLQGPQEQIYVIPGSPELGGTADLAGALPVWVIQRTGAQEGDWEAFGRALAVGDFNGDGADDLLVGAPAADPGGDHNNPTGRAYVFFGPPGGEPAPLARPTPAATPTAEPDSAAGRGGAGLLPDMGGPATRATESDLWPATLGLGLALAGAWLVAAAVCARQHRR